MLEFTELGRVQLDLELRLLVKSKGTRQVKYLKQCLAQNSFSLSGNCHYFYYLDVWLIIPFTFMEGWLLLYQILCQTGRTQFIYPLQPLFL